ncbi:MAG: bifunctional DNA-binding transcriptional regulator/O6-methylguanine-DNA methyltransferase Ada [Blastocatellia bacterium]
MSQAISEMPELDNEACWNAVQTRDARFNPIFVYSVRSTGIYCKPSCPSRRPRREQVEFFASSKDAESGGFRACLRCNPQRADEHDPQLEMVKRACRLIEDQTEGVLSLADLGAQLKISPYHLQRTFKKIMGVTPRGYATAQRMSRFRSRIKEGESVTDAMYNVGYGSSSRLYERANSELGMTPAIYHKGGAGMIISYAVVGCTFGHLLVARTSRGLCAVRLGETAEELEAMLFAEFTAAELHRDDAALSQSVEALLQYLDRQQALPDLPLDVQATAFQRRVWEELRRIPYGSTNSYGDIARKIGQPTAVRAVARACAANPVALVTPCHRVIREDGSLGGYRWGLERKQKLLAQEQTAIKTIASS